MSLKFAAIFLRFFHFFSRLPVRFWRICLHFSAGLKAVFSSKRKFAGIVAWWVDLLFMVIDLLGIAEFYETMTDFFKWKTRPLTPEELSLAKSVFGNVIDFRRVRVDENARIACRQHHLLYVSFFTINAWGRFRSDILIHELAHVWQYETMGAAYIPRALRAQFTLMGYNYGGVPGLKNCLESGGSLADFNLEQQADIVTDYFCIREGLRPHWGSGTRQDLPLYERFMQEVRPPFESTASR